MSNLEQARRTLLAAEDFAAEAGRDFRKASNHLKRTKTAATRYAYALADQELDAALEGVAAAREAFTAAEEAAAIAATRAAEAAQPAQANLF